MNYHPDGLYVWDTWYLHRDGTTHCFFLQQLRPCLTPAGVSEGEFSGERGAIGHAISDDLVEWETLTTALYPGPDGGYDDYDLWTGSCVYHDGKIYLFYTARSSREKGTVNRIALAISEDGIKWTRCDKNPILSADPRWYHSESNPRMHGRDLWPTVDCRDLCVVADPDGDGFWGFFAARQPAREVASTAVIGLCHSDDLIHWEQKPPCFVPEKYACIEVPDVFFLDGRWYMICLTGNGFGQRTRVSERNLTGQVSIYAVSDRIEGPYRELDRNVLVGAENTQGYCARTVNVDGERYLFYTQAEQLSGSNFGTVSLPKALRTDAEGHLVACWSDRIEKYFREQLINTDRLTIVENKGSWGSLGRWEQHGQTMHGGCQHDWSVCIIESWGHNFLYSVDVLLKDARSAGLILRVQGKSIYEGSFLVILDPSAGEVVFTQPVDFPRIENREWDLKSGISYNLKVTAIDAIVNVFIDDVLALQLHHPAISGGRFGLFVEQGSAEFSNVSAVRIG